MRVTILGCGSSPGVPMIGCDCAVCTSDDPKNNRTRVSLLIEEQGKNILIDTSPDLRQQMLRERIRHIDGILFTHDHADHTHGIDDMRSFNYLSNSDIPAYSTAATLDMLQRRFPYVFKEKPEYVWYRPCLTPHKLPELPFSSFTICDTVTISAYEQQHGKVKSIGYRIGQFAYSTDVNYLDEAAFEALKGISTWIVDCLRYKESHAHSHLEQTLQWIARVKPKLAVLTHMGHDFDYEKLKAELPDGVIPAYDGMILDL